MCLQASVVKLRISTECILLLSNEFAPSGESLLCDNGQLHIHIPLLNFFEKIAHMSVV